MNRTLENVGSGLDLNDITAGLVGQRPDLCVCVYVYVLSPSVAMEETVV